MGYTLDTLPLPARGTIVLVLALVAFLMLAEPADAGRRARKGFGEGLPAWVTCEMVRAAKAQWTEKELRAKAKAWGYKVTPRMQAEARACGK